MIICGGFGARVSPQGVPALYAWFQWCARTNGRIANPPMGAAEHGLAPLATPTSLESPEQVALPIGN